MSLLEVIAKAMQVDPVGASELCDAAVASWMEEEAATYDQVLQQLAAQDVLVKTAVAKRALGQAYVETVAGGTYPGEEFAKHARWLAGIEAFAVAVAKDSVNPNQEGNMEIWGRTTGNPSTRWVKRDQGGRFSHKLSGRGPQDPTGAGAATSPLLLANGLVKPNGGGWGDQVKDDSAKQAQLKRHQGQWEAANEYASDLYANFAGNKRDVMVRLTGFNTGGDPKVWTVPLADLRRGLPPFAGLNPIEDNISYLELVSNSDDPGVQQRVAAFNGLAPAFDGKRGFSGSRLFRGMQRAQGADEGDWQAMLGRQNVEMPATQALFGRMQGAANVLDAVPGGAKYAAMTRFVGTLGPEAERVLGPHVRQAAYRYRGTERTPEPEIVGPLRSGEMKDVRGLAEERVTPEVEALIRASADKPDKNGRKDLVLGSFSHRDRKGARGDQLKLQVNSDVAAAALIRKLPADPFVALLSEKSGHVLPSQGVIIDAQGKVVTQAVGYADDHYLPFDLKNMRALRGGQYVRTRVAGGLTGEDVYASVSAGARMATVVSTSGVYSLEMDPSFRGARGNSDKARSMYMRYLKILDAVDASGLYVQDLPPEMKTQIRQAAQQMAGQGGDWKALERELTDKRRQELAKLSPEDLERARTQTEEEVASEPGYKALNTPDQKRRYEEVYNDIAESIQEEKVIPLRLNAEGYKVALETLQQQFPYFIRNVSYEPLRQGKRDRGVGFMEARGQDATAVRGSTRRVDSGYVAPGGLRPDSVEAGFYRTATDMKHKTGPQGRVGSYSSSPVLGSQDQAGSEGGSDAVPGGTGDAPGTLGASPAASVDTKSASTPLGKRLAELSQAAQANAELAQKQMLLSLGAIQGMRAEDPQLNQMTFGDAKALKDPTVLSAWLFDHPEQMTTHMADPDVQEVLGDPRVVKLGFTRVHGALLFQGVGGPTQDAANSAALGGATTVDEAADYMAGLVKQIRDATLLTSPFKDLSADKATQAWDTSTKPLGFEDLLRYRNQDELNGFLGSPEHNAINETLTKLGAGADPDKVSTKVVADLRLLRSFANTRESVNRAMMSAGKYDDADFIKESLTHMGGGVTQADLEAAMGGPVGMGTTPDAIHNRALALQRARTFAYVQALIHTLEGAGGGAPKAPAGPAPASSPPSVPMRKSAGSSSPRVRFAQVSDPITVAVRLRKAAGLPLV